MALMYALLGKYNELVPARVLDEKVVCTHHLISQACLAA
jgi:hypothetical protein